MLKETDSQMEKIKEFLETCPLLEKGKINVDYLKDDPSYSIDRTPVDPEVYKFTDGHGGKNQIAFDFVVRAPISSQIIVNLANSKFCDDFTEWISMQNRNKKFPKIGIPFSIRCTSPGYIIQKTNTTAIYIIQINFTYYKK